MYLGCMSFKTWIEILWLKIHRLDGIVPNTPVPQRSTNGSAKRKAAFETPSVPKFNKAEGMSSPSDARTNDKPNGAQYVRLVVDVWDNH